ncbi:MAG: hypothetical protein J5859_06990 [Clostridia bacterium]|nr:hypothetical protein [Clostridia bacterium]
MSFPIDHDLHCHTAMLSGGGSDPGQTVGAILAHAKEKGYTVQAVTEHLWDSAVPGGGEWYAQHDIEQARRNLPLPGDDRVRMVFGCETEFCGGKKLGLAPEHYDLFEFIVIPPNHFHMIGFVRPASCDTEEKTADLLVERLEEISELDLPWKKVGIAHMTDGVTFPEGDVTRVFRIVDEKRYRAVMRRFARLGAGIELNLSGFRSGWREHEDDLLRLYRFAKEEGCRFYLASDAHHPQQLDLVPDYAPELVQALGLTEEHLYRIP